MPYEKWVPANWKWSSTIRGIDDIQNSSNFYLNIDLLCRFERDLLNRSVSIVNEVDISALYGAVIVLEHL